MSNTKNPTLVAAIEDLKARGFNFVLVHESAIMAWGMDSNVFLDVIDVLMLDNISFSALECEPPYSLGSFVDCKLGEMPARLWSRESLGLKGTFDVTRAGHYGCECLAPEIVLAKLSYSPDARLLAEQRAKLAATINASNLTEDELELYANLTRGA